VSRSPIYAFFGESINGMSTIRAFGAQERYNRQMMEFLDANIKIFYTDMYGNRLEIGLKDSKIIFLIYFFNINKMGGA